MGSLSSRERKYLSLDPTASSWLHGSRNLFLEPQCPSHVALEIALKDLETQNKMGWSSPMNPWAVPPTTPHAWDPSVLPGPKTRPLVFTKSLLKCHRAWATAWALQGRLGEGPPPLQPLARRQEEELTGTQKLTFPQHTCCLARPGLQGFRPRPRLGSCPSCSRPQCPSSIWKVCTWERESVGGSPSCEAHILPARARLRATEREQDQALETGSTDRSQAALAMSGQPAEPPTQTRGPWLCGHFSEMTSALEVLCFLPTSAQRAESPEPMSLERQVPAPVQMAHHWPWTLSVVHP